MYEIAEESTPIYVNSTSSETIGDLEKGHLVRLHEQDEENGRVKLWYIDRWVEKESLLENKTKVELFYLHSVSRESMWQEQRSLFNPYVTIQFYGKNKIVMQEPIDREDLPYLYMYFKPRKFRNSFGTYKITDKRWMATFTKENIVTENQIYSLPYNTKTKKVNRTLKCLLDIKPKREPVVCYVDGKTRYPFRSKYNVMGYEGRIKSPRKGEYGLIRGPK